ncbi:MAG: C69 family dipeptidase [Bacteroidetes bacterium]|uniref:Dipeptidase n=1 Tax=Candidatus Cryptobacteroides faecipullorum TaxID=2840764 RepID=A0A9D9I6W2_9BACT|nr:C69 family dipeptidase [Candidatus Cryptobacteroides faecipullorum]
MSTRLTITAALTAAAAFLASLPGEACTNILITKGASADGSCMVSYAADSHQLFGELYYHPAADWGKNSMLDVYEWDTHKFLGQIPQVPHTYQTVGNMNEHQLIIGETTYGGRSELWDSTGVMDYGSLIYIALQRARTAREAIRVIVDLADTYGYYSSGESFSIADKDEVWVMDLIGKGMKMENGKNVRKGIVWVARRVPDGYICAHANQSRISTFPLDDPENCMYAEDVISFAREMGYYEGPDEEFSFCDAYNPLNFGGMRGCEARAWSAFNILCDGKFTFIDENGNEVTKDAYDYIDYAMGYDASKRFPLFVKPQRKITMKNVADAMRDHYEGTPMDMTGDIGAGGNALPYRWRPMEFEYEGKTYVNERAIATQQTGFWFVGQSRGWLPDMIGGLLWFGTDDAATSYLTPIYTSTRAVPECFREGNGSMLEYSPTSAFWICNRVANACYRMYNVMAPTVRMAIDEFEVSQMAAVPEVDAMARTKYDKAMADTGMKNMKKAAEKADFSEVYKYLTDYSVSTAQNIFNEWVNLEVFLLLKYMDGNIKGQNPDGSFIDNGYSDRIPGAISNEDYTEKWKEAVVKDHGDVLEVK